MLNKYILQAVRLGIDDIGYRTIEELTNAVQNEIKIKYAGVKETKNGYVKTNNYGIKNETTIYEYYKRLINDTVSEIRKGRYAYIFSYEQMADVIKKENRANFEYLPTSDSFKVSIKKGGE